MSDDIMSVARFQHPLLADDVLHERLPGGCDLYVYRKPHLRRRHGLLIVDFGSIDVGDSALASCGLSGELYGLAHFLEHRLFAKPSGDITDRFATLGAEVDAHTSLATTGFSFTCLDDFDACLALLLELVLVPYFPEEAVDREREIITREIEMFEDSVESVAFSAALRSLYPNHPLGVDIGGTPESLRLIDSRALELAHRAAYRPARLGVFLSGDLDFQACRTRVSAALREYVQPQAEHPRPASRLLAHPAPGRIVAPLSVAQPRLLLAFAPVARALSGPALLQRELCMELVCDILFGPSSEFYTRHYESGLIDDHSFGYEVYAEPSFTFAVVGGDTPGPAELEEAIVSEISRARCSPMVADDFGRAMRKAHGHLLCRYDEIDGCAAMVHAVAHRGGDPFGLFEVHAGTAPDDVSACLEACFSTAAYGSSVVLPSTLGSA